MLVIITCFSLVMLFSASMTLALQVDKKNAWYYVLRQLSFSILGLFVMYMLSRWDIRRLAGTRMLFLMCLVVSLFLIIVLIPGIGKEVNNQRRWIDVFGLFTFQPSEIAKIAVVLGSACYYPWLRKARLMGRFVSYTPGRQIWLDFFLDMGAPICMVGFWCILISSQSHVSAAIILMLELLIVFLAAGIDKRSWKVLLMIAGSIILLLLIIFLLFGKQIIDAMAHSRRWAHIIQRFASFSGDANDTSYQPRQALIAIGSGGLMGVGLGMGVQKYNYLPEAHNDYVFAIICEELGLLGGVLVIALFVFYFVRGIRVALRANTQFGQIVACGFSTLIIMQALLSIAVNLQIIPTTGVSLPFFSYGGTSNFFFMIGIGLLLNVSKFGLHPRYQK